MPSPPGWTTITCCPIEAWIETRARTPLSRARMRSSGVATSERHARVVRVVRWGAKRSGRLPPGPPSRSPPYGPQQGPPNPGMESGMPEAKLGSETALTGGGAPRRVTKGGALEVCQLCRAATERLASQDRGNSDSGQAGQGEDHLPEAARQDLGRPEPGPSSTPRVCLPRAVRYESLTRT